MGIVLCDNCESPHFNIKWDGAWLVCCEGCGALRELTSSGSVIRFIHKPKGGVVKQIRADGTIIYMTLKEGAAWRKSLRPTKETK